MRGREARRRPLFGVGGARTVKGRRKGNSPLADGWVPPVSEGKERVKAGGLGCEAGRTGPRGSG
jgi:hypothetical protein